MKIVQINSVFGTGSTGRIVENIHNYLIKNQHESYVFFGRGKIFLDFNINKISNSMDTYYHGLKTRFFDKHGLASKNVTRRLVKELSELSPDIIHLHNIHGYYINYVILFNYLKYQFKGKVFWTMHDCWAFTGHCSYYTYVNCSKWKSHCDNCPQIKSYPKSYLIDNSFSNFEMKKNSFTELDDMKIIVPSSWLKNQIQESFLKNYKIQVINNGIDKSIFKTTDSNFRQTYNLENKFIILGVANVWDKRKGLDYFIELSKIIDNDIRIVVVGKLQKHIENSNILHIEKTDNVYQLAEIYSAADVFLNPTLEDNYPTTNLEALSCNTPVITFDVGGSPESLDNAWSKVLKSHDINSINSNVLTIKEKLKKIPPLNLDGNVTDKNVFAKNYLNEYKEAYFENNPD